MVISKVEAILLQDGPGITIDQEISNFLQSKDSTKTRFGSLEFGVAVPNRADPWTRLSYSGSNKPIDPIHDPQQMLQKMYGQMKHKESLVSILDDVADDLKSISSKLSKEDRQLLEEHMSLVRKVRRTLKLQKKNHLPIIQNLR